MAESAEELSWLDYFSGGVPTGEYFRMTLEDLRDLVDTATELWNRSESPRNLIFTGQALGEAVNNCNACHAASGSPFIKVTLEVAESLSLRHPHSFGKTRVPMEHMHKH